ncbi:MAG: chemotaxis protein CheB [Gammaproteobacteria bacterium]
MVETPEQPLRVALITGSAGLDRGLQQFLQHNSVEVVNDHALEALRPEHIDEQNIDVLLVDLEDPLDAHLQRLSWLIGRSQVPILFNAARGTPRGSTGNTLLAKLVHLARNPTSVRRGSVARIATPASGSDAAPKSSVTPKLRMVTPNSSPEVQPANRVWVLGASLGGPKAVSRFLQALPSALPLAFVYVQHIGANFLPVLTRQIERISPLRVISTNNGTVLGLGQIVVVPASKRFVIDQRGIIELQSVSEGVSYSQSIDSAMSEIARHSGPQAGAIIFSGMGDDGALGAGEIALAGGTIWAQDAQSCQISTMPDMVRSKGIVSFSGAPEQLAARLVENLNKDESS